MRRRGGELGEQAQGSGRENGTGSAENKLDGSARTKLSDDTIAAVIAGATLRICLIRYTSSE